MSKPVRAFIGPCPVCKQHSVTLYDDQTVRCEGVRRHAVFHIPSVDDMAKVLAGTHVFKPLVGYYEMQCGYENTARQLAYEIAHPLTPHKEV